MVRVSTPVPSLAAAGTLAAHLTDLGFRLDGRPCLTVTKSHICALSAEIRSDGTPEGKTQVVVATLKDDAKGQLIGLLTVSDDGR
jgi:hypothetical protein